MRRLPLIAALALCLPLPPGSLAGGSNYGIAPGRLAAYSGQVREWAVPTPEFARDPAVAPDGSIFIAVMRGNKVARFDPATQSFREWPLPPNHHPHGVLVDLNGTVWTTGNGDGTIGRLDPSTGKITRYKTPSGGGGPHTLVITPDGSTIWFTLQAGDRIGRLATADGRITEYKTSGGPYGLALDPTGRVWFCRMGEDRIGILEPASGRMDELALPRGSRPRRMAAAPDGSIWVTLNGTGKLVRIDTAAKRIPAEVALPGGADGGPYAVTVDGDGIVWANEINANTLVRLDPRSDKLSVVRLPTPDTGIRKMVVDAGGRLWYMGSHSGRLGVVQ